MGSVGKTTREAYRQEIGPFTEVMVDKLEENHHKGGWEQETAARLLRLLEQEVNELKEVVALKTGRWGGLVNKRRLDKEIAREAADVANLAFMIADNLGAMT